MDAGGVSYDAGDDDSAFLQGAFWEHWLPWQILQLQIITAEIIDTFSYLWIYVLKIRLL